MKGAGHAITGIVEDGIQNIGHGTVQQGQEGTIHKPRRTGNQGHAHPEHHEEHTTYNIRYKEGSQPFLDFVQNGTETVGYLQEEQIARYEVKQGNCTST